MLWRDAVLEALNRFANRHKTKVVSRQKLIEEELTRVISETDSQGVTPEQTLSRVLQELRDEGVLYFLGDGQYLFLDSPIHVEQEDLPADAIDFALRIDKLRIGVVPASDEQAQVRRRRGKDRIRKLALRGYGQQCAFCDVRDERFLVASHISRWADDPEARGLLSNVICMCRFHDALFESGFFSLSDDYVVLKKPADNQTINLILDHTEAFRMPYSNPPSMVFLRKHRQRTGF